MITRNILTKRFFQTSSRLLQETSVVKDISSVNSTSTSIKNEFTPSTVATTTNDSSKVIEQETNSPKEELSSNLSLDSQTNQESVNPNIAPQVKSKKTMAKKQPIVILNAHQSKLISRKRPMVSNKKHVFETTTTTTTTKSSTIGGTLSPISKSLASTKIIRNDLNLADDLKRLSAKSKKATLEDILQNIQSIKPPKIEISKKRYEQIQTELSRGFMAEQLREYCLFNSKPVARSTKKYQTIEFIMKRIWGLKQSDSINPIDDMVMQRVFHLTKRQLFLVLSQNVVNEWLRANVKISVALNSNQIIVHAPQQYIQYIEITIEGLLKNVQANEIDLSLVEKLMQKNDQVLPLEQIQKLSGVYFEISTNPTSTDATYNMFHNYTMFFLAKRKLLTALRLIVWSLNYDQHFTTTNIHINENRDQYKYFPTTMTDATVPWNLRAKEWLQLKQPIRRNPKTLEIIECEKIDIEREINLSKLHSEINSISAFPEKDQMSVTLVQFGNLLHDASIMTNKKEQKYIMNTEIPYAHKKVLGFPLDLPEGEEPEGDVDYHSYHAQLKLVPSPFNSASSTDPTMYPPIEFWFEINEAQQADKKSLQSFIALKEQHSIVTLPSKPTDLKFIKSITQRLTPIYNLDSWKADTDWLADQPGIKTFLNKFHLDFQQGSAIKIPDSLEIKLPGVTEPVVYNYVSMVYRTKLDFKFKNGRRIEYSILEGGEFGGRTTEIMMIGDVDKDMNYEEFGSFVKDTVDFVEELTVGDK